MTYDHLETVLLCEVWTLFGEHWMILQILSIVVTACRVRPQILAKTEPRFISTLQ